MFCSPLRYPGGKNKLAKFVANICETNKINGHYIEPYAGGAAVALYLLLNGFVSEITINDIDLSIYAFWHSSLNHTDKLCRLIEETEIDLKTWYKCKEIQKHKKSSSLIELGFSTFFLNRTNISGILDAGVIGGIKQIGKYKIDCRFNKQELIRRIRNIAKYRKKINLRNMDALELVSEIQKKAQKTPAIFYFDPPYYLKGKSLYLNFYEHDDHVRVSKVIKKIRNARWIVSYDNVNSIKKMYDGYKKLEYTILHTARTANLGNEVLFFSSNLITPNTYSPLNFHFP